MRKISFRALVQFVAVAEHRSFTRAAQALHVAQPWLSSRIKELETLLGVELFDRTPRGVVATEAGEALLRQARRVLQEGDRFVALAEEIAGAARPPLRLGASYDTYNLSRRAQLLDRFAAACPQVPLEIANENDAKLRALLTAGRLDASFVVGPPPEGLEAIPFDAGVLELMVPAGHPLAALAGVPIERLVGETVLAWRRDVAPDLWDVAIAPLADRGVNVAFAPESARRALLDRATRQRQLTVLPSNFRMAGELGEGYLALPLTGIRLPVEVSLVRSAASAGDRRVDALWRLAREICGDGVNGSTR